MKKTSIKILKERLNGKHKRRLLYKKKQLALSMSTFLACVQMAQVESQPIILALKK